MKPIIIYKEIENLRFKKSFNLHIVSNVRYNEIKKSITGRIISFVEDKISTNLDVNGNPTPEMVTGLVISNVEKEPEDMEIIINEFISVNLDDLITNR